MFILIAAQANNTSRRAFISIHLMFILIVSPVGTATFPENDFNTSHVYINPAAHAGRGCRSRYFNTSHVYINRTDNGHMACHTQISIHLMFILILFSSPCPVPGRISIHLMFILIRRVAVLSCGVTSISIHLMFILIQRFYQLFRFYYISNSLKIPAFSNFSQV